MVGRGILLLKLTCIAVCVCRACHATADRLGETTAPTAIQYLHISKTGGTNMCMLAYANNCHDIRTAEKLSSAVSLMHILAVENCWSREMRDGPLWVEPEAAPASIVAKNSSCADRRKWMDGMHATFFANENFFTEAEVEEHLCRPHFLNVITLREPMSRMLSHLQNIYLFPKLQKGLKKLRIKKSKDKAFDMKEVAKQYPFVFDNPYVRSLCGQTAYGLPSGEITNVHFEKAVSVLSDVDFILNWQWPTTLDMLRGGLGWTLMEEVENVRKTSSWQKRIIVIEKSNEIWLRELNRFDLELYQLAYAQHNRTIELLKARKAPPLHSSVVPVDTSPNASSVLNIRKHNYKTHKCCGFACAG
jgi:hypothetical protein